MKGSFVISYHYKKKKGVKINFQIYIATKMLPVVADLDFFQQIITVHSWHAVICDD